MGVGWRLNCGFISRRLGDHAGRADARFGSFVSIFAVHATSALPPIATRERTLPNVSNVPLGDIASVLFDDIIS